MVAFENGLEIWAHRNKTTISVNAPDYTDRSGQPLQDAFDGLLARIPETPRIAMTVGILDAINEELNNVLDG